MAEFMVTLIKNLKEGLKVFLVDFSCSLFGEEAVGKNPTIDLVALTCCRRLMLLKIKEEKAGCFSGGK